VVNTKTIKIESVICDPEKYPRAKANQMAINMLQAVLKEGGNPVPAIEINQNNFLIDGFHRLQAHKLNGDTDIEVIITECADDNILWLATQRNSTHGQQLSRDEKKKLAKKFFNSGKEIPDIQSILSVGHSQLYDEWLKDEIANKNEAEQAEILDLYLRCYTEEEITDKMGIPRKTVEDKIKKMIGEISENGKTANRPDSIQDYNLWEFNVADDEMGEEGFVGRMPGQVVENLLWYFTEPFDLVVDPMAGGGTTLDVCLTMNRRCLCYDINSIRPHDIKKHDILEGLPELPKLRKGGNIIKPKLILLDPPYWKQKKSDGYTLEATNLANLPLDDFHSAMVKIINDCHDYIDSTGYVAYIISPTRSEGIVYDHMASLINKLDFNKWQIKERIIVSYTTQQALAYHLTQAREGKYMLRKYRDLLILQPKGKN
jgi:DNA modification methylase